MSPPKFALDRIRRTEVFDFDFLSFMHVRLTFGSFGQGSRIDTPVLTKLRAIWPEEANHMVC